MSGSDFDGRTFANKSRDLQIVTLMLLCPPAIGVVVGAFRAIPLRAISNLMFPMEVLSHRAYYTMQT